jgi:hypothetical protein
MKTPLQELIEWMEQNQYFIGNDLYDKQKKLLANEREQNHWKLDNVFELGASAFQDCLNPHTLEFDHETYKRLKEEAVNQNKDE